MIREDTWPKILKKHYEKYAQKKIAMRYKQSGIWKPYSWEDYYLNVKYLALGLRFLGFEEGDKVGILGNNAPQWYYAEIAAQANRGISVLIYSDATDSEIKYILSDSDCRFAIVECQEQVDKFLQIKDELPLLRKVIYWNPKGLTHYDDPALIYYKEVLELGKKFEETHPGLFERDVEDGKGDDICVLIYASDTTGAAPKGAMLSYTEMRSSIQNIMHYDLFYDSDNVVSYMPPAWIGEQWYGFGCHLISAYVLNFPEGPETKQQDLREVGPDMIIYSSSLWETQAALVQAKILEASAFKRLIYHLLMPVGYKIADLKFAKKKTSLFWKSLYVIANVFLFSPLRDSLGLTNVRICHADGAPLNQNVLKFYHALRIPIKNNYWKIEGGFIACSRDGDVRLDSVGIPNIGTEIKIMDQGEIVVRQAAVFSGYYKKPEKTAEVLKDGWVYTGDAGFINDDGHLVIMGRVKGMVTPPTGNKLAP
jgi:long-chain acyl-CoA synthetase